MKYRLFICIVIFLFLDCHRIAMSQYHGQDTALDIVKGYTEKTVHNKEVIQQDITIPEDSIYAYKKRQEFAYVNHLDSLLKLSVKLKVDTFSPENSSRVKPGKNGQPATQNIYRPGTSMFNNEWVHIFLWLLAAGFILFILYKLFLGDSLFKKEPATSQPGQKEEVENVLQAGGYDRLINEAVRDKNFRLAIRFLYLQVLQTLSQAGAIEFTTDKTNYEYVRELYHKPYQPSFALLTLNYEYVWYGRFEINEALFEKLRKEFNEFHQITRY